METDHICKICNRCFANGKAMGGHMRSHLAKLPLPPKPIPKPSPKSPSSSSSLNYPSSENPMQSYRSVNRELSVVSKPNLASLHDGESETESPKNPTRRRSKRRRKSAEGVAESSVAKVDESSPEQVSSISDIFSEEDVAMCLLMLSRDKRTKVVKGVKTVVGEYTEEVQDEEEAEDDDDCVYVSRARSVKSKYRCETCKKAFRSYQALGGHRASHKKIKTNNHTKEEESEEGSGSGGENGLGVTNQRIFKCPFCDKVFESGQALGGHKKVHFSYLGNPKSSAAKSIDNLLDLNLPAPEAREDDGEISQV